MAFYDGNILNQKFQIHVEGFAFDFSGFQKKFANFGKIKRNTTIMTKYQKITEALRNFSEERDWDQFHDSRNLALALLLEASELNEIFLWKKDAEVEAVSQEKIKEELADVFCYAIMLADKHNLDVYDIIMKKIARNKEKYPVDKAKGTAKKYNEL